MAESCSTARQEVGAWIVPISSVDSSGLVPIKSKLRQRTVSAKDCSPSSASCLWSATVVGFVEYRKMKTKKILDKLIIINSTKYHSCRILMCMLTERMNHFQ